MNASAALIKKATLSLAARNNDAEGFNAFVLN
jgi:hypothetical protein